MGIVCHAEVPDRFCVEVIKPWSLQFGNGLIYGWKSTLIIAILIYILIYGRQTHYWGELQYRETSEICFGKSVSNLLSQQNSYSQWCVIVWNAKLFKNFLLGFSKYCWIYSVNKLQSHDKESKVRGKV